MSIPNFSTSLALVETATKCLATACSLPSARTHHSRAERALVSVSSVVKVLEETIKRFCRVEIAGGFYELVAVDIGDEAHGQIPIAVVLQGVIGHVRTEVGAADTDVDDIAYALAGIPLPLAAANPVGEIRHLVQHGVNLWYHILAINND